MLTKDDFFQKDKSIQTNSVNVYLRTYLKKGFLVKILKYLAFTQLQKIIQEKLKIKTQNMILFYKGERISEDKQFTFQEKSIIHVIDYTNVKKTQIQIYFKMLNGSKKEKFLVDTTLIIENFVQNQFSFVFNKTPDQILFVYTGRKLQMKKSFEEQFIEDQSQILILEKESLKIVNKTFQSQNKNDQEESNLNIENKQTNTQETLQINFNQKLDSQLLLIEVFLPYYLLILNYNQI